MKLVHTLARIIIIVDIQTFLKSLDFETYKLAIQYK